MARRSSLRASDEDRDRVADRLRQAAVEGRLLAHELEERLATVLRARTYGELDATVSDLPTAPAKTNRGRALTLARRHPLAAVVMALAVVVIMLVVAAVLLAWLAMMWVWLLIGLFIYRHRTSRVRHQLPLRRF